MPIFTHGGILRVVFVALILIRQLVADCYSKCVINCERSKKLSTELAQALLGCHLLSGLGCSS
jgi:hypothetical protein